MPLSMSLDAFPLLHTQQDQFFSKKVVPGLDGIWLKSTILVTTKSLSLDYTFYFLRHWHTVPWCPLRSGHFGHGAIQLLHRRRS